MTAGCLPRSCWQREVPLFTGQPMLVDLKDLVGQDIATYGAFEAETAHWVHDHLKAGDTFIDVGGHWGQYSLLAGHAVGSGGRVHVFEPGDKQRAFLEHNVKRNGLAQVRVNDVCVGEHSGRAMFIEGPAGNLGQSYVIDADSPMAKGKSGPVVTMTTLDAYVKSQGITSIGGMKIDVEGAEESVLRGGVETFAKTPPGFVLYETEATLCAKFGGSPQRIHAFFRDRGYAIHAFIDGRLTPVDEPPAHIPDFIAIRR